MEKQIIVEMKSLGMDLNQLEDSWDSVVDVHNISHYLLKLSFSA